MDLPIEIFLSFIGFSMVMGIVGLWKKVPFLMFIAGGLITFWAITTDNIIMNDRIDNIVATESTFNITGSITEIPDYSYNVITGTQALVLRSDGSNVHGRGEHVTATSVLIGQEIECINLPMLKTGSPIGTAEIGIMDSNNAIIKLFGTKNVSSLTTTFTYYEFCLPDGESYEIQANTYIELRWVNGTISDGLNNISVLRDNSNVFDGTNTVSSAYTTSWTDTTTADNTFQLYTIEEVPNNIQVSGIGGIYSYENNEVPFTEYPKILFGIMASIFMIAGALIWKLDE